jgi:DNA modification methylase
VTPAITHDRAVVYLGDCVEVLAGLPEASVDAIVTDPPYALPGGFMGKSWDAYEGREDAGFGYWLAGLIDGEGHFAIKAHSRGSHAPAFALKMRKDERGTLEVIRRHLGVGTIRDEEREPHPTSSWVVQDKAGCQRLVDLLDKYPLRAKKRMDYALWREAVCEWTDRPRGNRWHGPADNTRMVSLRQRIMAGRQYVDPPWSGHEYQDWCRLWAMECLRVLRPGGHLLAFGGTRTYHRLTCAIEDAGFEIRDEIAWLYGSGFPKSLDVGKAIDKMGADPGLLAEMASVLKAARLGRGLSITQAAAQFCGGSGAWGWYEGCNGVVYAPGEERAATIASTWPETAAVFAKLRLKGALVGSRVHGRSGGEDFAKVVGSSGSLREVDEFAPATPEAQQWAGWGTALKPAHEPIVVARKPLAGTVARNVLEHGTGGLNIDGCRVEAQGRPLIVSKSEPSTGILGDGLNGSSHGGVTDAGRWPPNVVLDGSQADALDRESGITTGLRPDMTRHNTVGAGTHGIYNEFDAVETQRYGDTGGASRFFPTFRYEAKAPSTERPRVVGVAHPTVKPLALMSWLVRLVTPPSVPTLVCSVCGQDVRGVRTGIHTETKGTDPLRGGVSAEEGGALAEGATPAVSDVRQGVDGQATNVLFTGLQGDLATAAQPDVSDVLGGVPPSGQRTDVLHEAMRRQGDGAGPSVVRTVLGDVSADDEQGPVLLEDLCSQGLGVGEAQGASPDASGVHRGVRPGTPDGDANGLPPTASPSDGGAPGPNADPRRGGASPQRGQGRQPPREPGSPDEAGARQDPEAAAQADRVSPLRRDDRGLGSCPHCDGALVRGTGPGVVCDPFAGSGTTLEAAVEEGFYAIGIEREPTYLPLIEQRINRIVPQLFFDAPPAPRAPTDNGRDGEASADRRYTERGGTNFAPLPGRRRTESRPVLDIGPSLFDDEGVA